jgi:hypothetical protein
MMTDAALTQLQLTVASTAATSTVNGNTITSTGTFQRADGSTGTIADVTLGADNFNTTWLGDHTISAAAAMRPGFGMVWKMRRPADGGSGALHSICCLTSARTAVPATGLDRR